MLKKIVGIENVGRFLSSAHGGNTQFAKHTVLHGANGYGKTTICTIFRSVKSGDGAHILGRKTLGASAPPAVNLLMQSGNLRFDGKDWSSTHPTIAIFDHIFVAENIHAGEIVDTQQKRGLYRVIVGEAGVALAERESKLSADSRTRTTEITKATAAVKSHMPDNMKIDAFIALEKKDDIDQLITAQESKLKTVSEAATIKGKAAFATITMPALPDGLEDLLAKTIEDLGKDAEKQIAAHLAIHKNLPGTWINQGLEHADETCPFCGEELEGVELITAYRAVFGYGYKNLRTDVAAMKESITQAFGPAAVARFSTVAETHKSAHEFWARYCVLDAAGLTVPTSISVAVKNLGTAALALVEQKASAPLDAIIVGEEFRTAAAAFAAEQKAVDAFNGAVAKANDQVAAKKAEAGDGNTVPVQAELTRLKTIKTRHEVKVAALCAEHTRLTKEKADIDSQKDQVRKQLDQHTAELVKPYENRINEFLEDFNAGFTIAETKHTYTGGVATSSYQIVINRHNVDIGAGDTHHGVPSFRNTLSAGDKSTLALAFFLAHLERTKDLANTIVVFDDPFNSQDSFRRRQTTHEIIKVGRKCAQVIVMSHDATFLKELWEKCQPAERASLGIADHGQLGSKIIELDIEKACRARTATDIDHLLMFYNSGVGEPLDVIRKMRTVLETHLRLQYPSDFADGDWLGDMIGKIRTGGASHPAHHLYDKLNEINDSAPYHHGENVADTTPDQIDPVELKGLVRRTLRITNNLQA